MKNKIEIIPYHPLLKEEMVLSGVPALNRKGLLPSTGHEDDAGIDCYALESFTLPAFADRCKHPRPNGKCSASVEVKLGFGVRFPKRTLWDKITGKYWHADVTGRSNQNDNGVQVMRGIVDNGYEGEIAAFLINMNTFPYTYEKGERICQLVFYKCRKVRSKHIKVLKKEARKNGGFGSTGK